MFVTMFLLFAIYLAFLAVLFWAGAGYITVAVVGAALLLVQYFYSDRLVLWSLGARIVSPTDEPELHGMLDRLAALADLPKPRLAVVDSEIPNALATGRSQRSSVVAVTRGLAERLDPPELEAVLAHELTHVKNRDVTVITIASFLSTVAFFVMRNFAFMGLYGGRRGRDQGGAGAFAIVYLASLLVWLISFFLIRALSRYREYAADRGSAIITGAPSQLASALLKISGTMQRIPQRDLREVEGMNAFFIFPAVGAGSVMELFSTHPSLEHRLARLERMQREMEGRLEDPGHSSGADASGPFAA